MLIWLHLPFKDRKLSNTLTLVEDELQSQMAGLDLLHLPLLGMDCNPNGWF